MIHLRVSVRSTMEGCQLFTPKYQLCHAHQGGFYFFLFIYHYYFYLFLIYYYYFFLVGGGGLTEVSYWKIDLFVMLWMLWEDEIEKQFDFLDFLVLWIFTIIYDLIDQFIVTYRRHITIFGSSNVWITNF